MGLRNHKYHDLWQDYMADIISEETFQKEYRNPNN
jgi:hypothetical protein